MIFEDRQSKYGTSRCVCGQLHYESTEWGDAKNNKIKSKYECKSQLVANDKPLLGDREDRYIPPRHLLFHPRLPDLVVFVVIHGLVGPHTPCFVCNPPWWTMYIRHPGADRG